MEQRLRIVACAEDPQTRPRRPIVNPHASFDPAGRYLPFNRFAARQRPFRKLLQRTVAGLATIGRIVLQSCECAPANLLALQNCRYRQRSAPVEGLLQRGQQRACGCAALKKQ